MRRRDEPEAQRLAQAIQAYEEGVRELVGIRAPDNRAVFLEQLVESERRVRYVEHFVEADISPSRADPGSGRFDPIKAAILKVRLGNPDEASWLIFLFTHFGKHPTAKWKYCADIYGGLGAGIRWDWERVRVGVTSFRDWLADNEATLSDPATPHGFGNHRKYESLGAWSENGTGAVVASYVQWVEEGGGHLNLFNRSLEEAEGDSHLAFASLFQSMRVVRRFGRTARFDYLSMIGKIRLAAVSPGRAYLVGSTGPLAGARLLFGEGEEPSTATALDDLVIGLEGYLEMGFDPLEDALCNWQKSPNTFKPFRG